MKRSTKKQAAPELPPASDWRTSDQDEILKRRIRAREETFRIENLDSAEPIFSNFEIHSASGMSYRAEIRDIAAAQYSCTCTDFRINGLGTCKHIEALLLHLARRQRAAFSAAKRLPSPRIDLVPHAESSRLRIERNLDKLPARIRCLFDSEGFQISDLAPESLHEKLLKNPAHGLRISQDAEAWLAHRARERD
ncbi:MAG: SWIM zinc finger domain-containing protein [Verrucomicrobia bacterium]|nr:SWIM zinc finger domain-containing protein [Verrucomicrobiota bacterium]